MDDYELAITLAATGAEIIRRHFGTNLLRLDKGAGDFATNADIEAENAMLALLRSERPEDAVLGEESGQNGPKSSVRTWLIDPLCGTLNFAARMHVAAVNVALLEKDKFITAAVANPYSHEIYWTDGIAAYSRTKAQDIPLSPDSSSNLVDINLDPPYPNAPEFKTSMLISDSEFAARFRPRVVSSSIALAWVATGQRAAYVTDGDVRNSVHYSAGIALCEAAGCRVTDLRGQKWGSDATGLIVAADDTTHNVLISLVKKYLIGQREKKMDEIIKKLNGANMDIDMATPEALIEWKQEKCPWNAAEQSEEHKCAVKNVSICRYFCGIEYLDTLLCCYPHSNPLKKG